MRFKKLQPSKFYGKWYLVWRIIVEDESKKVFGECISGLGKISQFLKSKGLRGEKEAISLGVSIASGEN